MKYKINAKLFNAVMAAQSDRNEIRSYLQGFFLCAEHNELVATNGRIMCIAPIEPEEGQPDWKECNVPKNGVSGRGWIFSGVTKPFPKAVEMVAIDTDAEILHLYGAKYRGPEKIALSQIDGTYPDYRSVKVERDPKAQVHAEQGFNTEYLYRCFKWAGLRQEQCKARMIFAPERNKAAEIRIIGNIDLAPLHITMMPVWLSM